MQSIETILFGRSRSNVLLKMYPRGGTTTTTGGGGWSRNKNVKIIRSSRKTNPPHKGNHPMPGEDVLVWNKYTYRMFEPPYNTLGSAGAGEAGVPRGTPESRLGGMGGPRDGAASFNGFSSGRAGWMVCRKIRTSRCCLVIGTPFDRITDGRLRRFGPSVR